ncbi:hypothetical protein AB8O53_35905, partial [Streptomyces pilosus]
MGVAAGRPGAEVVEVSAAGTDGAPPGSRSSAEALASGEAGPAGGPPVASGGDPGGADTSA